MTECSSWIAPTVTLATGEQVPSDSEAWRAECEARAVLAMGLVKRSEFFELVGKRRGDDAAAALKRRCYELEPHFVLGLPNKQQRNAYLATVEQRFGPNASDNLRAKVLAIHHERQAVAAGDAQAA